jgi:2-oxoglutarate ferredoxin oxidoreductase subunit alpha
LRWLNPLPKNLGDLMKRFKRVILPELNKGQLCMMLRSKYLVDVESYSKVDGQPFKSHEITARLTDRLSSLKNQGAAR